MSNGHSQKDQKLVFKAIYCLMQAKIIKEEYSLTLIKLPLVIKIFVLSFLRGRFTQVLLLVQVGGV